MLEVATLSAGGCNPKCWILQPDGTEAATLCSSLEQVVLADSGYVVLTGAAGCRLHLFTLNGALVWSASIDAGVSALTLSPCGGVLLCGYDDGALFAWSLHDRCLLVRYAACPAPVVSMVVTESHVFVATSRADLLVYLLPDPAAAPTGILLLNRSEI